MQLDKTRIVIRERSWLEILDLASLVLRAYAPPLAVALAVGAIPAALLNAWLLRNQIDLDDALEGTPVFYVWYQILLVAWEAPIATSLVTLYLGQTLFMIKPQPRELAASFWRSLPQLIFFQFFLRGLLGLFLFGIIPYTGWPYLNEVILLERNPWRARKDRELTSWRRAKLLHGGMSGEFFGFWLGAILLAGMLIGAFWASIWLLRGLLVGEWRLTMGMYTVALPLVEWVVVGYFAVVRYLSYLDLRIRREGWEVELSLRAERARLTPQVV